VMRDQQDFRGIYRGLRIYQELRASSASPEAK
jgi:hypothetical protein